MKSGKHFHWFFLLLLSCSISAGLAEGRREQLELRVLALEGSYTLEESEANRYDLAAALGELAQAVCMPHLLRDLDFAGRPEDPECLKLVDRLEELDLGHPAILCIHDGIRSKACQEAYQKQVAVPAREITKYGVQRAGLLASQNRSSKSYGHVLMRVEKSYQKEKSGVTRRAFVKEYQTVFAEQCGGITERQIPEDRFTIHRKSTNTSSSSQDRELDALRRFVEQPVKEREKRKSQALSQLGDEGTTQPPRRPPIAGVVRLRILPDLCYQHIDRLLKVEPLSSLAICQRDGLYSIHCVRAIRNERQMLKKLGILKSATGRDENVTGMEQF